MAKLCIFAKALTCLKQIFHMEDDTSRSSAFPISVHFHNLRGLLAIPHMEGVVATACDEISVSRSHPDVFCGSSERSPTCGAQAEQPMNTLLVQYDKDWVWRLRRTNLFHDTSQFHAGNLPPILALSGQTGSPLG